LMDYECPVINGDGSNSRDFTYIENVIQMNIKAALTDNTNAVNQVYNVAYGERTNMNQLIGYLKKYLVDIDPEIAKVKIKYGPNRAGDVAHSLASIKKARELLNYDPIYSVKDGLKEAISWYAHEKRTTEIWKL
jgi:UDP-N-acetylglucosamine 4-epimerase